MILRMEVFLTYDHIWATHATVSRVTLNDASTNALTSLSIISLLCKSDTRITN